MMITPTAGVVVCPIDNFFETCQTNEETISHFFAIALKKLPLGSHMQIIASDLAVRRGDDFLFMNVSLNLTAGDALLLKGPNGAGKSTFLRAIAGLIQLEQGSICLRGDDLEAGANIAEACHYLGHKNAMKHELTVEENLSFWQKFLGNFQSKRSHSIGEAAERLGLSTILHLPFGFLSAGQQRRMAMAKLLCAYRPIWVLDEPTSALDVKSDALFVDLLNEHLSQGGIVIAATHQPLPLNNAKVLELSGFGTEARFL